MQDIENSCTIYFVNNDFKMSLNCKEMVSINNIIHDINYEISFLVIVIT